MIEFTQFRKQSLFIISVLISGRTALFVALFIGIFSNFIFELFDRHVKRVISNLLVIILSGLFVYFLSIKINLNLTILFQNYFNKMLSFGGEARVLQYQALIKGIYSNFLLGSGQGVGVNIIRNTEYPWRYELLYLATLYRVGLIGFIIYSLPAFFVFRGYLKSAVNESHSWLSLIDRFMLIGFIATIIISAVDPYLESFEFQWMFFAQFVYFIMKERVYKLNGINSNGHS